MEKESGGDVYPLSRVSREMDKSVLEKKQVSEGLSPSGGEGGQLGCRQKASKRRHSQTGDGE